MGFSMIGYVGFSATYMTVDGALNLGMTNIWQMIGQYAGCAIGDWAYGSHPDYPDCWDAFDDKGWSIDPPDAWWLQVGAHVDETVSFIPEHIQVNKNWTVRGIRNATLKTMGRMLWLSNLPLYLSPVASYLEGTAGFTEIAWQECIEAVDQILGLVSGSGLPASLDPGGIRQPLIPPDSIILPGPRFPGLTSADLEPDGIHPLDPSGRLIFGQVLKDFPAFQP
jgi:hypothetical protein